MKNIISAIFLLTLFGLASCGEEGPRGPEGQRGPEGPQGPAGESGFVFEYENVSFTAPEYQVVLPFPNDFEAYNSDVALVYLLWDVVEIDGIDTEVWRQVPQTLLTQAGMLQYNFDFTMIDVKLFMDADFDMSLLGAIDTDDWVVRVVIVPGDFWNSSRLAAEDLAYEDLEQMLGLPELPTPKSALERRK